MNLDLIDAQKTIKEMLLNNFHNNRLVHAYIFNGLDGVGKREMAYFFAAMLYCKDDVCFKCNDCMQIFKEEHMNVYEVKCNGNMIKKDQIISLQEEFSKTSLVDGPRVYIIDEADKMNVGSANSLLKFIEEPNSPNVYAILLTNNISNLLPTIVSRCGIINFKSMDKKVLYNLLINDKIDSESASLVSNITNNIVEAKEIIESEEFKKTKEVLDGFLNIKKPSEAVIFLQNNMAFFDNQAILGRFLELLTLVVEDALKETNLNIPIYKKRIDVFKKDKDNNKLCDILKLILDLKKKLDANVVARNVITNLFINIF